MSEPRIAALHFTPRPDSPWAKLRVGMTWAEVRALGLLRTELSHRLRQGRIVFDPPLTRKGQVIAADNGGGRRSARFPALPGAPMPVLSPPVQERGAGEPDVR